MSAASVAIEGITITKRGKPPGDRIWAGRCSNCGTEIEAVQRVLKVIHADQRDGPHARLDCPVCKLKDGVVLYPKHA